ncbi:unnamed protein product, partial [Brachionus calyciflorus]
MEEKIENSTETKIESTNSENKKLEKTLLDDSELKKLDRKFYKYSWISFISILITLGFIALIITGTSPCLHTKCHENAMCINHPFKAECVCNYGYAGNGLDHCDECSVTYFEPNVMSYDKEAVPYSWPAYGVLEASYTDLIKIDTERVLVYLYYFCGVVIINRKT